LEYVEVAQARQMDGLRLVLTAGVPGPWGEAAKGILHVKRLPYVAVQQVGGAPNPELAEWTGQTSAPVAAWNDERPRTTSLEILFLAERLAPDPPLIPRSALDRALMLGLSHEIIGEMGLGWCRRMMMFGGLLQSTDTPEAIRTGVAHMGAKYGYDPEIVRHAPTRVAEIVAMLAAQLERQHDRGSRFLVGRELSALDIYWATFAAILDPLPQELCPMPAPLRVMYHVQDPAIRSALTPSLLEHRDIVYREHLLLPMDF
jgi:glutathione S-transferase